MIKKRKPNDIPDKFYVHIFTPEGNQKFRKYSTEKYARKKETLPDGWKMEGPLKIEDWKDKRKYFRKKWWSRFLRWVRKYDAELSILILLLILIVTIIALFIKD